MRIFVRSALRSALVVAMLVAATTIAPASPVMAKSFDVTGTLECGTMSGHRCDFADWEQGPVLGIITEDISGEPMRFEVDTSWIRDRLVSFSQDDFVWLVVQDNADAHPRAIGVVQHHCTDGRYPPGQVNQGQSDGQRCR
jgi:hypothetical protein